MTEDIITEYERDLVDEVERKTKSIGNHTHVLLKSKFGDTRWVLTLIATNAKAKGELTYRHVALMGIVKRCHEFLLGGVQEILAGNRHMWMSAARGLMETHGAACWALDNPENMAALVEGDGVKIGKLINASKKHVPQIEAFNYSKISGVVHPYSASLLIGFRDLRNEKGDAFFVVPGSLPSSDTIDSHVMFLVSICDATLGVVHEILETHTDLIREGRKFGKLLRSISEQKQFQEIHRSKVDYEDT